MSIPAVLIAALLAAPLSAAETAKPAETPKSKEAPSKAAKASSGALKTDEQKILYTLGVAVGRNLRPFDLTPEELKVVTMGIKDDVLKAPLQAELNVYGPRIQELEQARLAKRAEKEKKKSQDYLDKAAKEPGAKVSPSGLIFLELRAGEGPIPASTDTIKAHYEGKLMDGTVFDSSYARGAPIEFAVTGVIPCWTEALLKMRVGGKARVVCPSKIGYGDGGNPPRIPGGAALDFQVELMEIVGRK